MLASIVEEVVVRTQAGRTADAVVALTGCRAVGGDWQFTELTLAARGRRPTG
jgi:hypothetical protein